MTASPALPRRIPPALVLAVLVAASAAPYLGRLGFYSDDWDFLSAMAGSRTQDLPALLAVLDQNANLHARPVHLLQLATLYSAFGLEPLGYHVVDTIVLAVAAVLMYLALGRLRVRRSTAFAAALIFALSPAYSTDRFWYASSGYVLTMAAYFLSLYADLRAVRHTDSPRPLGGHRSRASGHRVRAAPVDWRWKGVALLALATSASGHEVAIPLLVGNLVLLVVIVRPRLRGGRPDRIGRGAASVVLGSNFVALAAILAFKASTAIGAGIPDGPVAHVARLASAAAFVQLGSYGLALPTTVWWAAGTADLSTIITAALIGAATFAALLVILRGEVGWPTSRCWALLVGLGLLTMALGYAIFLTTPRFDSTGTGVSNRIHIAGTVGAGILLVALAGLAAARAASARSARLAFAAVVAVICCAFSLTVGSLSQYWVDAATEQQAVLDRLERALPELPPSATVVLLGACPYRGPAVVFESYWDLRGALAVRYRQPSLKADVVTPRLHVDGTGLRTTTYGVEQLYPYGPDLYLYDDRTGAVDELSDVRTAERRIAPVGREVRTGCPAGTEGAGERVLPLERLVLGR